MNLPSSSALGSLFFLPEDEAASRTRSLTPPGPALADNETGRLLGRILAARHGIRSPLVGYAASSASLRRHLDSDPKTLFNPLAEPFGPGDPMNDELLSAPPHEHAFDGLASLSPEQQASLVHLLSCDHCAEQALGRLIRSTPDPCTLQEDADRAAKTALRLRKEGLELWFKSAPDCQAADRPLFLSSHLYQRAGMASKSALSLLDLGLFYSESGEPSLAVDCFTAAAPNLQPSLEADLARAATAYCLSRSGDPESAAKLLDTLAVSESTPKHPIRIVWLVARTRLVLSQSKEARRGLEDVLAHFCEAQQYEPAFLAALDSAWLLHEDPAAARLAPALATVLEDAFPKLDHHAFREFVEGIAALKLSHQTACAMESHVSPAHRFFPPGAGK